MHFPDVQLSLYERVLGINREVIIGGWNVVLACKLCSTLPCLPLLIYLSSTKKHHYCYVFEVKFVSIPDVEYLAAKIPVVALSEISLSLICETSKNTAETRRGRRSLRTRIFTDYKFPVSINYITSVFAILCI